MTAPSYASSTWNGVTPANGACRKARTCHGVWCGGPGRVYGTKVRCVCRIRAWVCCPARGRARAGGHCLAGSQRVLWRPRTRISSPSFQHFSSATLRAMRIWAKRQRPAARLGGEGAGKLAEAVSLLERTLAGRERVLGGDHPDTLTARRHLAGAYLRAGRVAEAVPLLERTLADSERVLGGDHADTVNTRSNLAGAYLRAGRLAEAVPLLERTLADSERVLGRDHPD